MRCVCLSRSNRIICLHINQPVQIIFLTALKSSFMTTKAEGQGTLQAPLSTQQDGHASVPVRVSKHSEEYKHSS